MDQKWYQIGKTDIKTCKERNQQHRYEKDGQCLIG
jgi:hypothetical protein